MILIVAIGVGLVIGLGWAKWVRQPYRPPTINHFWIVIVGFLPQFFAIYLWNTRTAFPDWLAALSLAVSQFILFFFAWLNRSLPGMLILIIGLILNLTVILANHGFMPVSPQTAARLVGEEAVGKLETGSRFGLKDILLATEEIRLEFLSDRFLPPVWFPYQVAFSLGDVFLAFGAFWMLAYQKSVT